MQVITYRKFLIFILAILFINLGSTGKLGSMIAVFIDTGNLVETG